MHKQILQVLLFVLFVLPGIHGCSILRGNDQVCIEYYDDSQVIITTSDNQKVFIDIVQNSLIKQAGDNDVLLVTDKLNDHYNQDIINKFPGKKIILSSKSLKSGPVSITSVPSSLVSNYREGKMKALNYIMSVKVNGLNIVHFGNIGQGYLTHHQKEKIGPIDVAIIQICNSISNVTLRNKKIFCLIDQQKPKLVIPSHNDLETTLYAFNAYKGVASQEPNKVFISRRNLPRNDTRFLAIGLFKESLTRKFNLPELR